MPLKTSSQTRETDSQGRYTPKTNLDSKNNGFQKESQGCSFRCHAVFDLDIHHENHIDNGFPDCLFVCCSSLYSGNVGFFHDKYDKMMLSNDERVYSSNQPNVFFLEEVLP